MPITEGYKYNERLEASLASKIKFIPTDADLQKFKADLLELAELVDAGDADNELNLQPILGHLYITMKQTYDIVQSYRS